MSEYTHGRHAVYAIKYHLVWIPKRRKPVLVGEIAARLRAICEEVAADNGWTILELAIQPDHVHLFVEATVREAPYQVVRAFKGRSSRLLREEFPELLKLPSLWTRAYFAATVGHVSQETIARYIEEQTGED
jgi:putative transposase